MRTPSTTADAPDARRNHTMIAMFWLGVIYLLSWKPEVLERLLDGSEAVLSAFLGLFEGIRIF
jgi:hypothetical protein